jgi:hypothetical protein
VRATIPITMPLMVRKLRSFLRIRFLTISFMASFLLMWIRFFAMTSASRERRLSDSRRGHDFVLSRVSAGR